MLARAVSAVATAQEHNLRSTRLLEEARERLNWMDHLRGESRRVGEGLRAAVMALAQAERRRGEPPERVITLLKKLMVQAGGEQLEPSDGRTLMEDVVRWGIEAYYAA